MTSASKPFQTGLLLASAVMLCGAASIWASKSRDVTTREATVEPDPQSDLRRAAALLLRSYRADNELSYSALSHTIAFFGSKSVESVAQITRAPRHLSIKVISGAMDGSQSGYSDRWFWRQSAGKELRPFAQVADGPDQMCARRFALLTKNYTPQWSGEQNVDGRATDVVELRPNHPIDGAQGPARRLFIDQQSGLTLRIDAFNCALKPVTRSSLSELDLKPQITEATFEAPTAIMASLKGRDWQGEDLAHDLQSAAQKTGVLPPRPAYLPPGFQLEGYGVHRCRTTGTLQLAAVSRYTDGLNTLTLFAFQPVSANIQKNMRGACDFGPGAMSSREDSGGRLVAMGDLPSKTLERVLGSAKFETSK